MKKIILLFLAVAVTVGAIAQTKSTKPATKTTVKAPTKIQIYLNKKAVSKLTLEEAKNWADSLPLLVKGDNGKIYKLHSFEISVINKDPYQMQEFGIGMDGFPLLARRAIDSMKEGDSVFLKSINYLDEKNQEIKLPNLIFAIAGAATK